MGFKHLRPRRKEVNMLLKIAFSILYLAAVQAKNLDNIERENWSNWPTEGQQHFEPSNYNIRGNFGTMYHNVNHGRLSGKEFPREVFQEMEGHARRSGCNRDCLMCLSQIKCTEKMKNLFPQRCHNYEGYRRTLQGSMPQIPGFREMEPMEQFIAQIHQCEDCSTQCRNGLANTHCSDLLKKWIPQICSHYDDKNLSQMDTDKGLAGDH